MCSRKVQACANIYADFVHLLQIPSKKCADLAGKNTNSVRFSDGWPTGKLPLRKMCRRYLLLHQVKKSACAPHVSLDLCATSFRHGSEREEFGSRMQSSTALIDQLSCPRSLKLPCAYPFRVSAPLCKPQLRFQLLREVAATKARLTRSRLESLAKATRTNRDSTICTNLNRPSRQASLARATTKTNSAEQNATCLTECTDSTHISISSSGSASVTKASYCGTVRYISPRSLSVTPSASLQR